MMKELITGLQHIGLPTADMDATTAFYKELGFEVVYETINEANGARVAFLKQGNLTIEAYEDEAKMATGSIDHVAIDVTDIAKVYEIICEKNLNTLQDTINFLPFWDNGVKFFTILGPNKERVEFSQMM